MENSDMDEQPFPELKPRYRVNAKQTSKGLFYYDITVETHETRVEWQRKGSEKAEMLSPTEVWSDLASGLEDSIHQRGGRLASSVEG